MQTIVAACTIYAQTSVCGLLNVVLGYVDGRAVADGLGAGYRGPDGHGVGGRGARCEAMTTCTQGQTCMHYSEECLSTYTSLFSDLVEAIVHNLAVCVVVAGDGCRDEPLHSRRRHRLDST